MEFLQVMLIYTIFMNLDRCYYCNGILEEDELEEGLCKICGELIYERLKRFEFTEYYNNRHSNKK